jgi:outer membrane protein assembly factor BamA
LRLVVAIVAAVICATAIVRAEETAPRQRLASVDIEGQLLEPKTRLLAFLGLKPEAPFGQAEQNRLNLLLARLGYRQLRTEVEPAGPGYVRLTLALEPVRIVRNLIVRHNWPLFDDEIIRHLSVRTGQPLPADAELRALLDQEAENVRKFLFNEGYFEATVTIEPHVAAQGVWRRRGGQWVRDERGEWIDLVIRTNLGRSYQLQAIEATYDHSDGPEHMSEAQLYEIFHHWLRFKVSQMREDQRKAEKVLREAGFPAARVTCDFVFERDADRRNHTVRLPVRVAIKRRVEVRFVGNRTATTSDLRDQLTIFSSGAYDEVELGESAKAVQREYQKRGYFEARVTFRRALVRPPPDRPGEDVEEVTFTVDEGPELKVRRVDIVSESGAPLTFAADELKDKAQLETRPFPPLGSIGLGEGGYVTQVQLAQDADRLAGLYKSRGFPSVKVRSEVARDPAAFDALGAFGAEATGAGGGGDLYVRFLVDEGQREVVDHVEILFVGPHVKDELDVYRALHLGYGSAYTHQAESEELERIKDVYKSSGHPLVQIDPTTSWWYPNHDRVVLRYIITEGPEVRFGAILVRGNFQTHAFVIRRDLPFKPGDRFDYTRIEAAERNLQTHLIFNAARVEPQWPSTERGEIQVGPGPLTVPILVTVQERYLDAAGSFTFALGAASDRLPDYLYASASYLWPNVFGIGSQLELKIDFAWLAAFRHDPITWGVSARYTDVRVFGPGWRLDLTGFYREEVTNKFGLITSPGGSLQLTRNLTPALRAFVRYDVYRANLQVSFLRILGSNDNSAVSDDTIITKVVSGLIWDRRVGADGTLNPLAPVKGWLLSGALGYSHPNGPAPTQFLAFEGQALGLLPFHVRGVEFTLLGNLRYAHGFPIGQPALPLVERFFAGGDTTTRGYDTDTLKSEIIPSNPSPLGGSPGYRVVPEGGNIRFLSTVELQFPIARTFLGLPLVWTGSVFWDVGAIVNGLDQVHWNDFRHAIGISLLRLITPVGPLSFEYAYPLTQTLAEERWKTSPWYTHFPGRIHFNWGIPLSRL